MFILFVGVVVGLAMFLQVAMFTVAGEHLTMRMRKMAFAAMLKQEMGWFDQPNNNTGALCSRLSADAAAIQGVSFVYITVLSDKSSDKRFWTLPIVNDKARTKPSIW